MPDQARRTANRHPQIADELSRIIARYSMRNAIGYAALCKPRDIELVFHPGYGNPEWSGHTGKVCYATADDAVAAAQAIRELPGADPVRSYACPRGGHYHHVDSTRPHRTAPAIIRRIAAAAQATR
jgi:hypothetical protein